MELQPTKLSKQFAQGVVIALLWHVVAVFMSNYRLLVSDYRLIPPAVMAFWAGVVLIAFKRPDRQTRLDLLYLRFGFLAVLACYVIFFRVYMGSWNFR